MTHGCRIITCDHYYRFFLNQEEFFRPSSSGKINTDIVRTVPTRYRFRFKNNKKQSSQENFPEIWEDGCIERIENTRISKPKTM